MHTVYSIAAKFTVFFFFFFKETVSYTVVKTCIFTPGKSPHSITVMCGQIS